MNIQLSIIIPAYNCEKSILELLNTIVFEAEISYEVIIIDDGSRDNTLALVKEYCFNKDNYLIYHKTNEGAPKARNKGLDLAKGEYIYFCDSDDLIRDATILEKMIDLAEQKDFDIVIADLVSMNSDGDLTKHKGIPNRLEVLKQNKYYFCDPIPGTKLYRRSFLCHNNLRFADVKIGQDLNFYLKSVALTNNIGYLNECIYIYRCSLSGISRTYKLENLLQIKSAIAEAEKYCRLKGVFDTNLKKIFTYVRLTNYVWQLKKKSHIKKNDYETLKNELFSEIKLRGNLNLRILWCCFPVIVEYLAIKYLNIVIREI